MLRYIIPFYFPKSHELHAPLPPCGDKELFRPEDADGSSTSLHVPILSDTRQTFTDLSKLPLYIIHFLSPSLTVDALTPVR
ncbi:hypothetical protein YC2023_032742 [Brassica napus]